MDDAALVAALNRYIPTEDQSPITALSPLFRDTLRAELAGENITYADLLVQAYVGRILMRGGERLVASLAHGRLRRRELSKEVRHTLLEMMLVVAMATLAYVLVKKKA